MNQWFEGETVKRKVFKMGRFAKFLTVVLLSVVLVSLFSGCQSEKKDWLYSCNSNNMLGFEGCYEDDGRLWLVFNTNKIKGELEDSALLSVKRTESWEPFYNLSVILNDGDRITPEPRDVYVIVSGSRLNLVFDTEGKDVSGITGIRFRISGSYFIDIKNGDIEAVIFGGECSNTYTQHLNADTGKWGKVENEFKLYPMTALES